MDDKSNESSAKQSKVGSFLFSGNWVKEKEKGVKWAFFNDKSDPSNETDTESEMATELLQEADIQEIKQVVEAQAEPSETISITELAKKYPNRYSADSQALPIGLLKPDVMLFGRYNILDLYKTLENRYFYKAQDTRLDTFCIVKELREEFNTPEEKKYYSMRFQEEAKILADLSHPNLPKVIDYFAIGERYFMVIDYIKGFELETIINNKEIELTEEQILLWGIDICDVLAYLHQQEPAAILHRDIRPANLFIRESDMGIIVFNFSAARRQEKQCTKSIGYVGYASPEQIAGSPEPRSDIYSLGATLHYLFTKQKPRVPFDFKPVRTLNPSVTEYTEMVIKQALSFKIKDRFDNAEEMKEALLDAYESLPQDEEIIEEDPCDPLIELAELLKQDGYKKIKAIKEIGNLGDTRGVDYLLPLLNDESSVIKINTINALEMLGDLKVVPALAKLARDENNEIKTKALKTIQNLHKKGSSKNVVVNINVTPKKHNE